MAAIFGFLWPSRYEPSSGIGLVKELNIIGSTAVGALPTMLSDGSCTTALPDPEGPSTQYLRTLVPKAIKGMVFGTRVLTYWVLGPSGSETLQAH